MKDIKLIVLDVDGTLTDGKIYIDSSGNEMKAFNVKDGMVIAQAIKYGIDFAIITGRNSKIVEKRAIELGIKHVYQGIHNKKEQLELILKDLNININNCAYIGDDINDLEVIKLVKFSACPSDASSEIIEHVDFVSRYSGGNGAVRDIVENILKRKDIWNKIITKYKGIGQ